MFFSRERRQGREGVPSVPKCPSWERIWDLGIMGVVLSALGAAV